LADPLTSNVGLAVPTRGSDSGTWDVPVNGNMNATDGMFGGVFAQSLTNANVTLSVPAGFTATPSAGPTQSQNAIIRFTGSLSGNCVITFPRPGIYVAENRCTVGSFYVQLTNGGGGEVIGIPDGEAVDVYSDGTNMRFRNLGGRVGTIEHFSGISAVPPWIGACTVPPYLLCDGSIYNVSTYPFLGAKFGATFGGNGSSTFGVPDLRGRYPLALDASGLRVTNAISNVNAAVLGAAGGDQSQTSHSHSFSGSTTPALNSAGIVQWTGPGGNFLGGNTVVPASSAFVAPMGSGGTFAQIQPTVSVSISGTTGATGNGNSQNMPPVQVTGIWLVRAA
jgi:microcystin-dependent protein